MRQMGIAVLGPKPRGKPAPGHRVHPYLLRELVNRHKNAWLNSRRGVESRLHGRSRTGRRRRRSRKLQASARGRFASGWIDIAAKAWPDCRMVDSFSRPGGNATGMYVLVNALVAKQLEVLREVVPGATTVDFIDNPTN